MASPAPSLLRGINVRLDFCVPLSSPTVLPSLHLYPSFLPLGGTVGSVTAALARRQEQSSKSGLSPLWLRQGPFHGCKAAGGCPSTGRNSCIQLASILLDGVKARPAASGP